MIGNLYFNWSRFVTPFHTLTYFVSVVAVNPSVHIIFSIVSDLSVTLAGDTRRERQLNL